jgi:hypothetical protein
MEEAMKSPCLTLLLIVLAAGCTKNSLIGGSQHSSDGGSPPNDLATQGQSQRDLAPLPDLATAPDLAPKIYPGDFCSNTTVCDYPQLCVLCESTAPGPQPFTVCVDAPMECDGTFCTHACSFSVAACGVPLMYGYDCVGH